MKGAYIMLEKLKFNLQLFADGGDGGDGGSASVAGESVVDNSGEDKILASIPEKAKKYYQEAVKKHKSNEKPSEQVQAAGEPDATKKLSYVDLIKSEDYKDEHKAYMDKAISDRFKKYRGLEENYGKAKAVLDIVAGKYGVSPDDVNFLEVLNQKIEADDSYYEKYAEEHDTTPEEARRTVTMERKLAQYEAERETRAKEEQARRFVTHLRQNAEKTKARFPQFDLDAEMKDERFRRLCMASNGDTTSAYMACHWNELLTSATQAAAIQAQQQTAQAVAANKARPVESGTSPKAPFVAQQDFKNMSLAEIRAYADEQRRKARR